MRSPTGAPESMSETRAARRVSEPRPTTESAVEVSSRVTVNGCEALDANPGSLIEASSSQDPYAMAQKAVEVGYAILQGKTPAETVTLIPTELVTRDNVDQYKGWTSK